MLRTHSTELIHATHAYSTELINATHVLHRLNQYFTNLVITLNLPNFPSHMDCKSQVKDHSRVYEFRVCALPSTDLAYTNCVYVSEHDAKLFNAPNYVRIYDGIFIVHPNQFVVDGEIAMSGYQRKTACETNTIEPGNMIRVQEASHDDVPFLKFVCFKIQCLSKRNVLVSEQDILQVLTNSFVSHFMYPGLVLPFVVKGRTFIARVTGSNAFGERVCNAGVLSNGLTRIELVVDSNENCKLWYEFNPIRGWVRQK